MDYETGGGHELHARQYTWSATAFLSIVYNMILGLEVEDFSRLRVDPFLLEELGDSIDVENLKIADTLTDHSREWSIDQNGFFRWSRELGQYRTA
jgi:hypothetical protein